MEHVTSGYKRIGYVELHIPWWIVLLEGIISIILGLFIIFEPVATTITLVQILGIFWFLGGVFTILSLLVDRGIWGEAALRFSRHHYWTYCFCISLQSLCRSGIFCRYNGGIEYRLRCSKIRLGV